MTVLVLGATGKTGQLVINNLLDNGQKIIALVRKTTLKTHPLLQQIKGTALTLDESSLIHLIREADFVISCLGHKLTFQGIYGAPRMLVRDSLKHICQLNHLINKDTATPNILKIILLNTTGNRNLDLNERISFAQHLVLSLIRFLIPPHLDNENAANYLRLECKQNKQIQWIVVRPDTLIDFKQVTAYTLHESPTRSALFDAGETSRINLAHFMARLTREALLFEHWKGKMPVIYNQ
ncbi:hypothetical protein MED121_01990 [Marinomonas sp. MED121]|uniref:NAD(P)H-binding protein n=1 Tax=Marinomonas sp. MED121 TaxID=314277 RepID=UPI0000690B21|nr:NAD(P)H-binding protein [Marinomonas sp. MED121]EAQ65943.1 hypothetical protein MED121_01990 [Marinomonas sp. MED121]